jgi:hypothetical protein
VDGIPVLIRIMRIKLKALIVAHGGDTLLTRPVRALKHCRKYSVIVRPKYVAFINGERDTGRGPVPYHVLFQFEHTLLTRWTAPREEISKSGSAQFAVNHFVDIVLRANYVRIGMPDIRTRFSASGTPAALSACVNASYIDSCTATITGAGALLQL